MVEVVGSIPIAPTNFYFKWPLVGVTTDKDKKYACYYPS